MMNPTNLAMNGAESGGGDVGLNVVHVPIGSCGSRGCFAAQERHFHPKTCFTVVSVRWRGIMKRKLSATSEGVSLEGQRDSDTTVRRTVSGKRDSKGGTRNQKEGSNFPHSFLVLTSEQEKIFDDIRNMARDQDFIKDMTKNNTKQRVRNQLWKAFKHAYKVDVDYRSWAKKRDSADPESSTFTAREEDKAGPLHNIIRKSPVSGPNLVQLTEREGMMIEGDNGVPLLLLLTSLQWEELKDEMANAGAEFSHNYRFRSKSSRNNFREIEDSPFKPGHVKHSVSWGIGGLTQKAMIHNDVLQDHAPADSIVVPKARKSQTESTIVQISSERALKEKRLLIEEQKHRNRESAQAEKYDSLSNRDLHSAHCWDELFQSTNKSLHIVNMILEFIDPEFTLSSHNLGKSLKSDVDKHGHHLVRNECHLPGVVYHWNTDAKAVDKYHTDRNSSFSGWDVVIPHGPHRGSFEVKELGICIDFYPGDILLLRGAAFNHRAGDWMGKGRFVTVPFCDRRLFNAQRVKANNTMPSLYGSKWSHLRHTNWYQAFPGEAVPSRPKKSSKLNLKM